MENLQQSCRTCLRELGPKFYTLDYIEQLEDITLIRKLSACVPEMNLTDWSASICFSCTATLRLAYEFREMCLITEAHIKNEYQSHTLDNKDSIVEQPVVNPEFVSPNESISFEVKTEEIDLEEDEDDWLRANGYFNSNSDDKDSDDFEKTDTAESDSYECISPNFVTTNHTSLESDMESIIKKSCENIKFLKDKNITPENLQCCVTIEKLPENYENCAIEDTSAANDKNDEPKKLYSCDQCKRNFADNVNYCNHFKYRCTHKCKICDKEYNSKILYMQHMKTHEGTSVKECCYCDRVFDSDLSYSNHKVYHKNRMCFDCNIHFLTREQLYCHKKEHKKNNDVNKKNLNGTCSAEQFSRIIVPEDVFEKAIKSFSTEIFDDKPPVIEKYCCSGGNCNCANKNSKNDVEDSNSFVRELPGGLSLKSIGNDFSFLSDSVRRCKEIAKKNIKIMSAQNHQKRILKQRFYENKVVSEHNYCKQYSLSKKIKQKKKKPLREPTIPDNSNIAKDPLSSSYVCNKKQTKNSLLQQIENSERTNTTHVAGDIITKNVILPNREIECNNGSKNEGDPLTKYIKVKQFARADENIVQDLPLNIANVDRSKETTETNCGKTHTQKPLIQPSAVNNMSLADLLKDTVNVNSKVRQGSNFDSVTLKDLLNNLDDPPKSLHVVTPFSDKVSNYFFPNSTNLSEELDVLFRDAYKPSKKKRPKKLKEVLNNPATDKLPIQQKISTKDVPITDNLFTQQQISSKNVPAINNLPTQQQISSKDVPISENLPTQQTILSKDVCVTYNTVLVVQPYVMPVHDNKLPSDLKNENNPESSALDNSKISSKKSTSVALDTIASPEAKLSSTLKRKFHDALQNKATPEGVSTKQSKQIKIVNPSNQQIVSAVMMPTLFIPDTLTLHMPTTSTNSFVPVHDNSHLTDLQESSRERTSSVEINTTPNLNQTTFPLVEFNTSTNTINPEKYFPIGNLYSTTNLEHTTNSTKSLDCNEIMPNKDNVVNSCQTNNIPDIQPSTSRTNSNNPQSRASEDSIRVTKITDLPITTNVIWKVGVTIPKTLQSSDQKNSSSSSEPIPDATLSDSTTIKEGPKNHENKSTSNNPDKVTEGANSDPVIINEEPVNQQTKPISLPTTLKNCASNKMKSDSPNKSTVHIINDSTPPNQQGSLKSLPATLKYAANKQIPNKPNKSTVRIINDSTPANKQSELKSLPTTLKYAGNKNTSTFDKSNKSTVRIINDSTPANQQNASKSLPTTLKYAGNKKTSTSDKSNKSTVRIINDSTPINQQGSLKSLPTTLKYAANKKTPNKPNKSILHVNNESAPQQKESAITIESDSDDVNAVIECGPITCDISEKADNIVDLTSETDTFTVSFNYIRNQIEGRSQNESNVNHNNLRVKPFAKERCATATVTATTTSQSIVEVPDEEENQNKSHTMPENFHASVPESNPQNVPEIVENTSLNVECGDLVSGGNNSENEKDATIVDTVQNKNNLVETPSEKTSEENVDHPVDIISLTKRNYDNEIKKLFNLTLKPLSSLTKTQNKETDKSESDDKNNDKNRMETSSNDCEMRLKEKHNTDLSNSSVDVSLNNNECCIELNSDKLPSTIYENTSSKHNVYVLNKNISEFFCEDKGDQPSPEGEPPASTFTKETVDENENLEHENTTKKDPNSLTEYLSEIADKLFETISAKDAINENTSTSKQKVICKICRKCFDYTFQRELHECQFSFALSAKKPLKDTLCERCGNEFTNEILKTLHTCHINTFSGRNGSKQSLKYICTVCNRRFSSHRLLSIHMNDAHANSDKTMESPPKTMQRCFFCKKTFKNGIYRFLHLFRHLSFQKHKCGMQKYKRKQPGKLRKYKLSELADVLQIGNFNLMMIYKFMNKGAFSKLLNKVLKYLHLVRCRKCHKISGGWFSKTLQSYIIKSRFNKSRSSVINVSHNYGLRRTITAKSATVNKQINPRRKMTEKQILIRRHMLRVADDLGLSAEEMNTFTSKSLKNESYQKPGCSKSSHNNTTTKEQATTSHSSASKKLMCKYCLVKFKNKLSHKMHANTSLHKQTVALLQKSEHEIEQELMLRSIDQPQTIADIKRAIKYTVSKIKMIKKYDCDVCTDSFISKNQLQMHRNEHKKFEFK